MIIGERGIRIAGLGLRGLISGQCFGGILTLGRDGMRDLSITDRLRNLVGIHRTKTRLGL
ncbi:hypothetical protein [Mycolicibacterium obuense]|uniref:hypothetical protein n=1 Tax=Mycolicibacterium obuense TaxID=1807 RepID=UPI00069B5062|nr:hypothetical protein [Mycolicibacterium obuense]